MFTYILEFNWISYAAFITPPTDSECTIQKLRRPDFFFLAGPFGFLKFVYQRKFGILDGSLNFGNMSILLVSAVARGT
jgi:hypothetical protein